MGTLKHHPHRHYDKGIAEHPWSSNLPEPTDEPEPGC